MVSKCHRGGSGRRDRLKICCPNGRVGSIPSGGTTFFLTANPLYGIRAPL